jgi:hypothetical protein
MKAWDPLGFGDDTPVRDSFGFGTSPMAGRRPDPRAVVLDGPARHGPAFVPGETVPAPDVPFVCEYPVAERVYGPIV